MRGRNGSSISTLITQITGGICMAAGLATVWLPIPTGLVLMVIGLTLLIASSPTIAVWSRLLSRRNDGLDAQLNRAESYLAKQMQRVLAKTKPNKTKSYRVMSAAPTPKLAAFTARTAGQPETS